jgi:uncharacterized protein YjeT (DUF2065 family)
MSDCSYINPEFRKDKVYMKFFFCVIGMVMIVEGLPYFAFPGKMKEMVQMMMGLEDAKLRKFGIVLMLAGLGIIYFAMEGQ